MEEKWAAAHDNMHPLATEFYDLLAQHEQQKPDPNEHIAVPGITTDSIESHLLASAGMSESQVHAGDFTRSQLIEAGFIFINKLGEGEKPLISGLFPATTDAPEMDTHRRVLLTPEELERINTHQHAARVEEGFGDIDIESTRISMLNFLLHSLEQVETKVDRSRLLFREAQSHILETGTDEENDVVRKYSQNSYADYLKSRVSTLGYTIDRCIAGIDLLYVNGVPIEMFMSRMTALEGVPSPYLDSGFHFSASLDVTMFPNDHNRTRRLNMGNIHLLSRGLDEAGSSVNGSHDQTYITATEFVRVLGGAPRKEYGLLSPENVELVATRLIAVARELG